MFTPTLNFNGQAEKTLNFYTKVVGFIVNDADIYRQENRLIAHAELTIYGQKLMLADVGFDNENYAGFSFSINLTEIEELKTIYNALNEEAEELMPLGKVDWSECYGLLKDKFGITWQFNLD